MRPGAIILSAMLITAVSVPSWAQDTYRAAYDAGLEDGRECGREDRADRQPFDFANREEYQDALRGFDSSLHDRDVYVVAYRRGFEDGYEDGWGLSETVSTNLRAVPPASVASDVRTRTEEVEEVVVPSGTLIKVRLLETLGTQHNQRGDTFRAEVAEAVEIGPDLAVPEGTRLRGTVSHAKRAGRIRGRAEMDLRFDEIVWPDGRTSLIDASVVEIEKRADEEVEDEEGTIKGKGTKTEDAKRVGVATGIGALIGIMAGGAKGGAITGAVGGIAGVLATRGSDILLYSQTELTVKLNGDVVIPTELGRGRFP
jgi:hypothetical protein